jgi:1-acyl-sn-glycerol-3-phosphate acyltransferase
VTAQLDDLVRPLGLFAHLPSCLEGWVGRLSGRPPQPRFARYCCRLLSYTPHPYCTSHRSFDGTKGLCLVTSDEDAPALYRALHVLVPPILNAVWRPTLEGLENIPEKGPAIIASNHLSFLDSVFVPALVPRPLYYLGKSDYFRGWQRYFFEGVGVMPVDRKGGRASEASLRKGEELLRDGRLLGIYPEGTRSPDGRLYRGKTGPVRLAFRTGAPIVPVGIVGTDKVLPIGARIPRVARVGISFGKPIDLVLRYGEDAGRDRFVLRSATDELMYEIMMLSGQHYIDEYAAKVKSGEVTIGSGDLDELAGLLDEERPLQRVS